MALEFDESMGEGPPWVKDCLASVASELYDKAIKDARENFSGACKKKDTTSKVWALYIIAKAHLSVGEYVDAQQIAEKAQEVVKGGDPKQEAVILHLVAKVNKKLCKYAEGLQVAEQAMGAFSTVGSKTGEAAAMITIATLHLAKGEKKSEALKVAKQAASTFQEVGEKLGEADALSTVARINMGLRKNDDALRSANEVLGIYEGSGDSVKLAAALLMVSEVRIAMSEYFEAEVLAQKAVELYEEAGEKRMQAGALRKLAEACFGNNNPTDGWTYVKEARDLCSQAGDPRGEASALCFIAQEHVKAGNYDEGSMIAEEGMKICRQEGFKSLLASSLLTIAEGAMALVTSGATEKETALNSDARKKGKEALALFQDLGDLAGQAKCLTVLALAFLAFGNYHEGKAKAKTAVQLCEETGDKIGQGTNMLIVAQTRIFDNKDEAMRLGRLAEKLLKESGEIEYAKGAEDVLEFIREADRSGGKKKESKTKLSDVQSEKTDVVMDLDMGKTRGAYFHAFTARTARAAR